MYGIQDTTMNITDTFGFFVVNDSAILRVSTYKITNYADTLYHKPSGDKDNVMFFAKANVSAFWAFREYVYFNYANNNISWQQSYVDLVSGKEEIYELSTP
jgi:hypothetical protein